VCCARRLWIFKAPHLRPARQLAWLAECSVVRAVGPTRPTTHRLSILPAITTDESFSARSRDPRCTGWRGFYRAVAVTKITHTSPRPNVVPRSDLQIGVHIAGRRRRTNLSRSPLTSAAWSCRCRTRKVTSSAATIRTRAPAPAPKWTKLERRQSASSPVIRPTPRWAYFCCYFFSLVSHVPDAFFEYRSLCLEHASLLIGAPGTLQLINWLLCWSLQR
jgi:hypothetical protein